METILSVGIDIGTTTSQVIFSRLTLRNDAANTQIPKISIVNKEIVYRSPIYMTPLSGANAIDGHKLAEIIHNEYLNAEISPHDITVGAVIITGESSRKQNAQEIVQSLGALAGDFVAASAGPDLEGILAGKGCGAARMSLERHTVIANIDIGGGTSNIAVFDNGYPIDTSCLDIGGRQIRFKEGLVEYIAPRTKALCIKMGLDINEGKAASPVELEKLCRRYVEILMEAVGLLPQTDDVAVMLTDHFRKGGYDVRHLTFSGGVAELFYQTQGAEDFYQYGDIGIFFAQALKRYVFPQGLVLSSDEPIRATVIGAGAFTTSVSGATINADPRHLPLKNVPVIKFSPAEEEAPFKERAPIMHKKMQWLWDGTQKALAFAFTWKSLLHYEELQEWAQCLTEFAEILAKEKALLVLVIEKDLAKAFGQVFANYTQAPFLAIDAIEVQDGDFLDIGLPLFEGKVVPVIVKSLAFYSGK